MYFDLKGHPLGEVLWVILFIFGVIVIFFVWLIVFSVFLILAVKEYRKIENSDSDKLKACKKKIVFRSVMTVIPLLLLFFII